MADDSVTEVKIKELENAAPGTRVRAVGMCFYGRGVDLTTGCQYRLKRDPKNPKDKTCIEVKGNCGRVKATLNAKLSRLMASLMDNKTIWETTCLVLEEATWSRGDSGRPARAHKILISFLAKTKDLGFVQEIFNPYNVLIISDQ